MKQPAVTKAAPMAPDHDTPLPIIQSATKFSGMQSDVPTAMYKGEVRAKVTFHKYVGITEPRTIFKAKKR